jgi:4,5-DOPA dioxygenase extradiol
VTTLFLSHGSPMHALEAGGAGRAWRELADHLPRPRAVLIASAHWETSLPMLTGREALETIHDFTGFPAALYRERYDAPGAPDVARRATELLQGAGFTAAINGCRGIDHGAWVPLKWMYPQRDVPVVQLSVQPELGPAHHLAIGEALAPLVAEDVLVIGSGHVTHNLRDWSRDGTDTTPLAYVQQFSDWLERALASGDRDQLAAYRDHAPVRRARILPRNTSCRCSWHWARRDRTPRAARLRRDRSARTRHGCLRIRERRGARLRRAAHGSRRVRLLGGAAAPACPASTLTSSTSKSAAGWREGHDRHRPDSAG